jgi:hypothetical protein
MFQEEDSLFKGLNELKIFPVAIPFIQFVSETWSLNTQQANKLLATEMDFWRRSARKSRKEKVQNITIREVMEVGKTF